MTAPIDLAACVVFLSDLPCEPSSNICCCWRQAMAINPFRFTVPGFIILRSNSWWCQLSLVRGQDGVFSIATRCGFERRWGPRNFLFSMAAHTGPGAHPVSGTVGNGFLPRGVKQPGRGVKHPSTSSDEVKEWVELYVFSLSVPPVTCYGVTFTWTGYCSGS